jgi:hypothetical protein
VRSRLPVSLVALIAATGVLAVAAAYTAGRLGHAGAPWADRLYWTGQALIVAPVAARLFGRRSLTATETVTLIVILTVAEYLVKISYSPTGFSYTDELMHWRSTTDILQTGKLFTVNNLLPISPYYPGLEEVTSAMVSITGLSLFTAGLIIIGVAHLMFVCVLYVLFRLIGGSHRLAGIAVLLYASNPLFQSFDSMFVYQTLALSFLGLAVLGVWRLASPQTVGNRVGWFTIAAVATLGTVFTHNVTSYLLVATLEVITLGSLFGRSRAAAAWASILALLSAVAFAGWIVFVAPSTVSYLQPAVEGALQGFKSVLAGTHSGARAAPVYSASGPLGNQALAGVDVLIVSALLPVGWWQVWKRYRRQPWVMAMAIGSVSWYVIVAVRIAVADGSELAGRAATFVYVPVGFIAAIAVIQLIGNALRWRVFGKARRWWPATVLAVAVLAGLVLIFDGLANGWPPYWERLPGPFQVAGVERSVGPEQIASADWALKVLGPEHRFATDEGDFPVIGSYGDQNPVLQDSFLYTTPVFNRSIAEQTEALAIAYVLVDRRLSEQLPASGSYFPDGAPPYSHPVPLADLTKFNHTRGVTRVYDSGNIVIYGLGGVESLGVSAYAP